LTPHQELVDRLREIPGFGLVTAWTVIAELSVDEKVFGGQPQRKRGHGRTRKGNRWIRRGLTQAALQGLGYKVTLEPAA